MTPSELAKRTVRAPAAQINVRAGITSPLLRKSSRPLKSVTVAPKRTSTCLRHNVSAVASRSVSGIPASNRSEASSRITRRSLGFSSAKSFNCASRVNSASAPALSTPVGPPPTTAKVNIAWRISALPSCAANSNIRSTWFRMATASSKSLRPKLWSAIDSSP